eukprot:gene19735-20892_t
MGALPVEVAAQAAGWARLECQRDNFDVALLPEFVRETEL